MGTLLSPLQNNPGPPRKQELYPEATPYGLEQESGQGSEQGISNPTPETL